MDCEYPFDRKTEKDSYLAFVEMPDSCFGFYKILFEKIFGYDYWQEIIGSRIVIRYSFVI